MTDAPDKIIVRMWTRTDLMAARAVGSDWTKSGGSCTEHEYTRTDIAQKAGWQPIETAPKDGGWFLACCDFSDIPRIVHWADKHDRLPIGEFAGAWASVPTHWMPLLDAPTARTAMGGE